MVKSDYKALESQLRELKTDYDRLHDQYKELQEDHQELQRVATLADNDVRFLLAKYICLRTPINRKRITDRGRVSEQDFKEWERGITDLCRKRVGAFRSLLFRESMDSIMLRNPDFREVPFFYYDFFNEEALYTPALLDLFDIPKVGRMNLSLRDLIRNYVSKSERRQVIEAFEKGEPLENYRFRTIDNTPRELVLNGFPLLYTEGNYKEAVGVGVFLYDPNNVTFNWFTALRFAVTVKKKVGDLSEKFQVIRQKH